MSTETKNKAVVNENSLTTEKQSAMQQMEDLKNKLAELKETEKLMKEQQKSIVEAAKIEKEEKEKQLFSDKNTEVVLNLRFTNKNLFDGSKYKTLEESEIVQLVLNHFLSGGK